MFLSSSINKFTVLKQTSVKDVLLVFPICMNTSMASPNLYKFGQKSYPLILLKKNCCDLNLRESLCIFTLLLFPDSGLYLLYSFDFYFELIYTIE